MKTATLFIVPTPIGNLGDITIRALDVLAKVDVIACEDTRHTLKLLNHYGIKKRLLSYQKFSEAQKTRTILQALEDGQNMALMSDSGMPCISDPGAILVERVRQAGFRIEVLPGPSAVVTAVAAAGVAGAFRFLGFFPRNATIARNELMRMRVATDATVFYEAPRRLTRTLDLLRTWLADRPICVAREMTKIYEEYITGTSAEVLSRVEALPAIGEVTVVVHPAPALPQEDTALIAQRARVLRAAGGSRRDVLKVLMEESGASRNELYSLLLTLDQGPD